MAVAVENPSQSLIDFAYQLYNATRAGDLPDASGQNGVDAGVRDALLDLTRARCADLGIPVPQPPMMTGMCIWASVVAAKFLVHKRFLTGAKVVRVVRRGHGGGSDHYVAVGGPSDARIICDITCNQFTGAPDLLVGTLPQIKSGSNTVVALSSTLYGVYKAAAAADRFVV